MNNDEVFSVLYENKIEETVADDQADGTTKINESTEVRLPINKSNVVSSEKLRAVQSRTLGEAKEYLARTFGPMGSNTKIIKGQSQQDISSSYSKDGLKVLSNIINSGPIEASIIDELLDVTRAVEKNVGDGTTSTVILSSIIFNKLKELESKYKIPPFKLCRLFDSAVNQITSRIKANGRACTIEDIYNISTHLNKHLDLAKYDFKMQLYRYIAHLSFNCSITQFYSDKSSKEIKKIILDNLSNPIILEAINNIDATGIKGKLMRYALKHKSIFLMKIYSKIM